MRVDAKKGIEKGRRGQNPDFISHIKKPGEAPATPGFPKGQINYKTRFNNALERISRFASPKDVIAELKASFPTFDADPTNTDAAAMRLWLAAMAGESWAFDRLFGKPTPSVDSIGVAQNIIIQINNKETETALKKIIDSI